MSEFEQTNQQLHDYYSFTSSILNFLEKHLTHFQKALITYSIVLKHLHTKSANLFISPNPHQELTKHLHHAFLSFTQTFDDEYHHIKQRAEYLRNLHLTIEDLKQKIHSSKPSKRQKYTSNRHKKRQYLYQLIQQVRNHNKQTFVWKDNLDNITLQTTNLLWKLFSYSPFKFDINLHDTPIESLSNSRTTIDSPLIEDTKKVDQLFPPAELGSGDQLHSKDTIPLVFQPQSQQIPNSNNALNTSKDDNRWRDIVKHDEIQRQQTTTLSLLTDQSSDDNENHFERKNSLHLSDISYTTDYYSQNESDEIKF